jgi:hypothetical protein
MWKTGTDKKNQNKENNQKKEESGDSESLAVI